MNIRFIKKAQRIYLDYASLTPISDDVLKVVKKYSSREYSNPSSLHTSGAQALKALKDTQDRCARIIHAHADEIIFTSGGTESNHLVLEKYAGKHIIISAIEHSSIIERTQAIHVPVTPEGVLDLEALKNAITPETQLISVMLVNNELGTIQPISEIAKIVRQMRVKNGTMYPLLHTDASQAPVHKELHVEKLGVDMMTVDSHKIYGPRGVGMLYVRRGLPEITRAGTENIPGIQGFTHAFEIAEKMREKETKRITLLKEYFVSELKTIIPNLVINGKETLPHILNVSIPGIDNEFFVLQLDARGIECSTKSACLKDEDESYVAKAIGTGSRHTVRFSFGRETTKSDLKKVLDVIQKIVGKK